MSMQPSPSNPIEARKQEVRRHLRSMVLWPSGGGVATFGVILFASEAWWLILPIMTVALVATFYHCRQVQQIVNHRDEY